MKAQLLQYYYQVLRGVGASSDTCQHTKNPHDRCFRAPRFLSKKCCLSIVGPSPNHRRERRGCHPVVRMTTYETGESGLDTTRATVYSGPRAGRRPPTIGIFGAQAMQHACEVVVRWRPS